MSKITKKIKIRAVLVFVLDQDKNFLLLKRADNSEWEPVKGGVNKSEDFKSAARRELAEETGFDNIVDMKSLGVIKDNVVFADGQKAEINGRAFCCYIPSTKPKPKLDLEEKIEHDGYKWVSYDAISSERVYPEISNRLIKNI